MMKMRVLACSLLLALSGPALADEVEEQFSLALEAYKDKDYKAAIEEINYALAQIQEKLNQENARLLPEALAGWTASEVENASAGLAMMGGGTNMSRSYSRGQERVEITVTAGSPMVAGFLGMINNPMLLANDPSTKAYRYKRIKGMKKDTGNGMEITLSVAGQIMVQINGRGVDEQVIEQYLDAIDFKKLEAAFLG